MKPVSMLSAVVLAMAAASASAATDSGLAGRDPGLQGKGQLTVSSSAFAANGAIPAKYTSDGPGLSPPLSWRGAPAGAKSFAVVVEDPDAPTPQPFIHWMIWNIPASASGLAEGKPPAGVRQGKLMYVGKVGYMGPAPPPGGPHHYHFQVFALDRAIDAPEGAERPALVQAMRGHVLASGELTGLYQSKR
jgi:Raf kinase inhibitor-like YbhB/YbcL family protein